jgi:NAD-dependent dihydropyrimidine dehydrogenase PreA subunit
MVREPDCIVCRACEEVCPVVAVLITDPADIGTDTGTSEVVEESEETPATPAEATQEPVMATGETSLFFHKPNKWLGRAKDVLAKEELPTTGIEKAKDMFKDLRKQTLDSLPRGKDYIALVDNEKCIGCTQCVYFCNFASIDMISWDLQARTSQFESKKALILEDTCTGCTLCAFACPVEAITMESRV